MDIILRPCKVCGKVPAMGYCAAEYFVYGDDPHCPGCGNAYTEMHSSDTYMAECWNRRNEI